MVRGDLSVASGWTVLRLSCDSWNVCLLELVVV